MASNAVPGFLPSVQGLKFANAFPPGPTLTIGPFDPRVLGFGDASAGLCGGMALTARDLFEAGLVAPPDTSPPANGSPRFQALVRRQVQSLDWLRVPLRYFDLQAFRPEQPTGLAALLGREPPRVSAVQRGVAADPGGDRRRSSQRRRAHPGGWSIAVGPDPEPPGARVRLRCDRRRHRDPRLRPEPPGCDDVELRVSISPGADVPWRDRIALAQSTR